MTARGPRKRRKKSSTPRGRSYQELVAEVARAFDPASRIAAGEWLRGPDGQLDMDVSIRGSLDGKPFLAVIECKDFDASTTGRVGRPYVDALDSKRQDLGANIALICSNAGFTRDALSKARRKGIGMISVLRSGDARARAVIEEEVVLCRLRCGPWQFTYQGVDDSVQQLRPVAHQLRFAGLSLDDWLQHRAALIAVANPDVEDAIRAEFRFLVPTAFYSPHGPLSLTSASVVFSYKTEWLSQIVKLDASLGLYDYLRRRVRIAPGTNSYTIVGIDFDTAVPTERPKDAERVSLGLAPGEVHVSMTMVEGLATESKSSFAPIEPLVLPEDLDVRLRKSEPLTEAV